MRIDRLSAAALIATVGLAGLVVFLAVSSADGAPSGVLLTQSPKVADPPLPRVPFGGCRTAASGGDGSVAVTGTCSGELTGAFTCVNEGEDEALSIRRPTADGDAFYLTIVIPEFEGPGHYWQDEVTAQLVGPKSTPRWTNLDYGVQIDATHPGAFVLGQGVLLPQPGTPASGVITVQGKAECR